MYYAIMLLLVGSDQLVLFRLVLEFRQFVINLYHWLLMSLPQGKRIELVVDFIEACVGLLLRIVEIFDCRFVVAVLFVP